MLDSKKWYSKRYRKHKAEKDHNCDICLSCIRKGYKYYAYVEIWHSIYNLKEKEYNNYKVCHDCLSYEEEKEYAY